MDLTTRILYRNVEHMQLTALLLERLSVLIRSKTIDPDDDLILIAQQMAENGHHLTILHKDIFKK